MLTPYQWGKVIADVEWIMVLFIMVHIKVLVGRDDKCCSGPSAWRLFEGKTLSDLIKNENGLLGNCW